MHTAKKRSKIQVVTALPRNMEVEFKNERIRKFCEDHSKLKRKYGNQAKKIILNLNALCSATSLFDISRLPQMRLHPLHGQYQGCFSIDLYQPYRMIIRPLDGSPTELKTITRVLLEEEYTNTHKS